MDLRALLTTLLLLLPTLSFADGLNAEAFFNQPGFGDRSDLTVENKLVDLIGQAVTGSTIRMSLYNFHRPAVAIALNQASHRGVDVRLVLDGSNRDAIRKEGDANWIIANGNGEVPPLKCSDHACVKYCKGPVHLKIKGKYFGGSCNGLVINHNKFFLFSKLADGSQHVVAQSSENLGDSQMRMYNDLVVIKDDRGLYDGYMNYWSTLLRDHTRLTHAPDAVGEGRVTAKFFPRLIGSDPVEKFLKRVNCALPGSRVRVSAAQFTRAGVASRLSDLAKKGCDVKIITRFDGRLKSPSKGAQKKLGRNMMILPFQGKTRDLQNENSVHTKMLMVDASIDGSKAKRQFVLTGSHNYDFFSLHTNDEALLIIEDRNLYDTYFHFWNGVLEDAKASGLKLTYGDGSH